MRDKLATNLDKLNSKENYFLDLAAEEGWPKDKLRAKLDAIRDDRKHIERTLEQAGNQLDDGIQFLTLALDLMADPHAMYQTGSEAVRTTMNRTIFTKLYVDGHTITDHELREPFNVLAEAYSLWQGYPQETNTTPGKRPNRTTRPRAALHTPVPTHRSSAAPQTGHGATEHPTASPALTLAGQGSNKTPMVDLVAAYSNRPDVLGDLEYTLAALAKAQAATGEAEHVSVRSERSMRAWKVSHRLTEKDVQLLIKEYHAGALRQELADRHKISVSSVGRLLRKHGSRLADQ